MEILAVNAGKARRITWQGRDTFVAPVTMIVPGVLNGSQGPLHYPLEEIRKNIHAWNNIPIVVYHPTRNGEAISAHDPDVLDKQQIGVILQAKANGKLTAQAYIDAKRTQQVDERVYKGLASNQPQELSTGLGVDKDFEAVDDYQGVDYVATARNYRPDHLAILPDQVGACSLNDGCGVLVNGRHDLQKVTHTLNTGGQSMALNQEDRDQLIEGLIANSCEDCWTEEDRELLNGWSDEKLQAQHKLVENAREPEPATKEPEKVEPEKVEPVENEFVPPASAAEWYKNAPPEVQETFRVAGSIEAREKNAIIEQLTANLSGADLAIHAERLRGRSLPDLEQDLALLPKAPEPVAQDPPKPEVENWAIEAAAAAKQQTPALGDDEPLGLPTMNTGKAKQGEAAAPATAGVSATLAELDPAALQALDPSLRQMVKNAAAVERRQKEELINQIVSNLTGHEQLRKRDWLETKSVDELQQILSLKPAAPARTANYTGAAAPTTANTTLTDQDKGDILPLPSMPTRKQA